MKIKWSEKVTNEVLQCRGEKRILLNNTLVRKANWIGQILRRDAIEKQVMKMKGMRRRTQLLDDFRNRRRHWKLKE